MQPFLTNQTALVLGGGGAKGAYEIGAMQALEALGIRYGGIYGVSVGAINAAMAAQGQLERAQELWSTLRLSDVINEEFLSIAEDAENLFGRTDELLKFLSKYAQFKGMDVTPLIHLLRTHIDERAVRESPIRMGVVATRFPMLSRVEKRVADMAPGTLHDWILASGSCFPVFPMHTIGQETYLDGGFCDNVPVEMAIRSGAQHIIALDIGKNRAHSCYDRRPNITYIRTSWPLGGLISFSPELSERNRKLGYNDVLRAFRRVRGVRFAFDRACVPALQTRAQGFVIHLSRIEADLPFNGTRSRGEGRELLFSLLEDDLPQNADAVDYLLRACEICGEVAGLDPTPVYTLEGFKDALRSALPLEKAGSLLDSLLSGRIGALFSAPQPDRKLVIAALCRLLTRENPPSAMTLRTLSAFPKELLCALTLREIL